MRALRITPSLPLPEALVHFMNLLPAHCSEPSSLPNPSDKNVLQVPDTEKFEFNEVSYLEAKNEIDKASFNQEILTMLRKQLKDRIQQRFARKGDGKKFPLVAVDLGAGLLNMLPTIQSIFSDAASLNEMYEVELQYVAFESNKNIEKHTIGKLTGQLGFKSIPSSVDLTANTVSTIRAGIKSFKKTVKTPGVNGAKERTMVVTVHLVAEDFMSENALKILNDVLGSHRCAGGQQVSAQDTKYTPSRPPIDLFVGCCVADLISPSALSGQVLEMAGDGGGLLYLPITFCGKTEITSERKHPDGPPLEIRRDILPGSNPPKVPDDSVVYSLYHNHLERMGHYLEPDRLLSELGAYGYSVLLPSSNNASTASSSWKISETKNPYMWKCMIRFMALGTAFQGLGKYNMKGWFEDLYEASKECYLTIDVSNIDILAVLPEIVQRILSPEEVIKNAVKPSLDSALCTDFGSPLANAFKRTPAITRLPLSTAIHRDASEHIQEQIHAHESEMASKSVLHVPTSRSSVEFLSPGVVHVVQEPVPSIGIVQLLVRTTCSLVSTGTELKIFSGDLDSDSPADLTISGMEDKMTYPLRYGYSSVGRVVAVGSALNQAEWMGKLVFSFSPHSSAVVVDASSVMEVPQGIEPEDAVFLPSVETAVSLVQAARPNIGERVLVVGQGLIGLLTGAVMTHHLPYTQTIVSDISEERLRVALKFNERALIWNPLLWNPWSNSDAGESDYDLSIEVSGNPRGLQTAIDNTGVNGRIIVGSWYGENPTPLKLGLKFHRSGLQLITSQVSNIHPELTGRWSKKRRFDLTWETLKQIKPSKLISSVAVLKSDEVLAAYIRLQKGEDVTVLFKSE
jgi:2-desacetyl-2-hydroxyethyl bacteriochlorophyllide A dehydrogenase